MFRLREYADKSTQYELETALRSLWRKIRHGSLFSYNELQFGNQIHDELGIRL